LLETLEKRIATWNEDSVLGDAMNKLACLLLFSSLIAPEQYALSAVC
jgi:hypothetical protein